MRTIALALLLALPAHAAGTLCFVSKEKPKCSNAEGPKIAIEPADAERTFVWSSSDGKSIVFGVAAPKSASINLEDESLRNVTLSLRGDQRRGWPQDVRLLLSDAKKHVWPFEIPSKRVVSLAAIRVPAGMYNLTLTADRHMKQRRRIDAQRDLALKEVVLRPLPSVKGRVVSPKDEPVPAAEVLLPDGKVLAHVNEQGAFDAEIAEEAEGPGKDPFPVNVIVRAPGFGAKFVPLNPGNPENDLGTIHLGAAHKLTLNVKRPAGEHFPVTVIVERQLDSRIVRRLVVASQQLAADQESVTIGDLGEAAYEVTLRGKEPLEDLTLKVDVKEGDVAKEVKIEPYRLDIYATLGKEPLRNGNIDFGRGGDSLPLDVEGHLGGMAWQHGTRRGFVNAKQIAPGMPISSPDLGADPSRWDIAIPARFIAGRVIDADSKQPVGNARIDFQRASTNSRFYSSTTSEADGSYSVLAATAGTYELTIQRPGFVPFEAKFEIAEDGPGVQQDLLLQHGLPVVIEAQWASGAAVAGAPVIEGVASDGYNPRRFYGTDANGRLTLQVAKDENRTLVLLPREGSFAIVHINTPVADAPPMRVVVPAPAGTLTVRIVDADGKPAAAEIGMRFNGETLPNSAVMRLPRPEGRGERGVVQMIQMPAGTYEVWPLGGKLFQPVGAPKPVGLSTGDAAVELVVPKTP